MVKKKLREIDHLVVRYHRGILTDKNQRKRMIHLQKGLLGESEIVKLLKRFLPISWLMLQNVWLEIDGSQTEVDILIIGPKFWWVIEVKNYEGNFDYRGNRCYLNQKQFPDQISACRNRVRIVEHIASKMLHRQPSVYCSIVFANELCQVTTESEIDYPLVMRYQFLRHVKEMLAIQQQLKGYTKVEDSLYMLQQYETDSPFKPQEIDLELLENAVKGIQCPKCNGFELRDVHRYFVCNSCQHQFSKEESVLRTACELGVLYFNHPKIITTKNVWELCGGMVSKRSISKVLYQQFKMYNKNRGTYYHNNALPYDFFIENSSHKDKM